MNGSDLPKSYFDDLATKIISSAFAVHREFGPGLLESVYQECITYELQLRGLLVQTTTPVDLIYKGKTLKKKLVIDLLVDDLIIVELKSVEVLHPVYKSQLITYLKLTGKRLGLLINFNVPLLKQGITRIANKL